jgi:hypothetical protein
MGWLTKLAGDSQRYNTHPFSDGGSVQCAPVWQVFGSIALQASIFVP